LCLGEHFRNRKVAARPRIVRRATALPVAVLGIGAEFEEQRDECRASRGRAVAQRRVVFDDHRVRIRTGEKQPTRLRQIVSLYRVVE
jgi:hypothetical protein